MPRLENRALLYAACLAALWGSACGSKNEGIDPHAQPAAAGPAPVGEVPMPDRLGGPHDLKSAGPIELTKSGGAQRVTVEGGDDEVDDVIARAQRAAITEAPGDTPCERARNNVEAVLQSFARDTPTNAKVVGADRLPHRAEFMTACEALPIELQRCSALAYAQRHAAECEGMSRLVTPAHRAHLELLKRSGAAVPTSWLP